MPVAWQRSTLGLQELGGSLEKDDGAYLAFGGQPVVLRRLATYISLHIYVILAAREEDLGEKVDALSGASAKLLRSSRLKSKQ